MALFSSFGQTYFIGVFGPSIQNEFDLSHTKWGMMYMLGTLGSAMVLPWSGKGIDHVRLDRYAIMVCLFLVFSCAFISLVQGMTGMIIALFLLRHAGQGLMSHVGITSMARSFKAERGRAIAVTSIGFAAGEAILPLLAVFAIVWIGWRWTYGGLSIVLALGLVPLVLWLLQGKPASTETSSNVAINGHDGESTVKASWTRRQVLRDWRFYLLLPGLMAPSFILTAMFFHHLNLADEKAWSHQWITGSYIIYAISTTIASLLAGVLIDRLGAVRLMPVMLLPLAAAMVIIGLFDSRWVVWPYMVLAGLNVGVSLTATSALWAELYGVLHLGAIRSLVQSAGVLATALGPVAMGLLVDWNLRFDQVCLLFAAYALVGSVLIRAALKLNTG